MMTDGAPTAMRIADDDAWRCNRAGVTTPAMPRRNTVQRRSAVQRGDGR